MATEAYCVKCGKKQNMVNEKEVKVAGKGGSSRRAAKGKCPACDTTMFRFLPNK